MHLFLLSFMLLIYKSNSMKYFRFLLLIISMMMVGLAQAQTIRVYKSGVVVHEYNASEVDSVVYAPNKVVPTTSLSLSSTSLSFKVGGATQRLTVSRNSGANDNAQLIWSSSDINVVTVAGNGTECTVEPVGVGSATIKVYVSGKENVVYATCPVSVAEDVVVGNVLIGEIRLGAPLADGVDASDVANILTDELIQKNIDEGFLFEKDYKDVLSVVRSSNTNNGYLDIESFSSFNYYFTKANTVLDWNGNKGFYNYHTVLVPSELSAEYIGVWGNDITMTGKGFDYPISTNYKNVVNKTVSFNGKNYVMYGYYINKISSNAQLCLTVIKK